MDDALFAAEPYTVALAPDAEPGEKLSADRKRTRRQAQAVARGVHPLALPGLRVRMHPDADPDRTATSDNAAARPLRCGTCRWRELVGGHSRSFPKCLYGAGTWPNGKVKVASAPRYSAGGATDVRAWWPACTDWQAREDVS